MDCELFLVSSLEDQALKQHIHAIVTEIAGTSVTSYDNGSRLSCKYFVIDIETEDITSIDFLREEYKLNINTELRIQLFRQSFEEGLSVLFRIFGALLNAFNPDMVFLENGTDLLFKKEHDQVLVNTNLDPYQRKYLSPALIESLQLPYSYEELTTT